jgi:hypothetical protein
MLAVAVAVVMGAVITPVDLVEQVEEQVLHCLPLELAPTQQQTLAAAVAVVRVPLAQTSAVAVLVGQA